MTIRTHVSGIKLNVVRFFPHSFSSSISFVPSVFSPVLYGVIMASKICQLIRNRLIGQISSRVFTSPTRSLASVASRSHLIQATLFPGDGIGPEIAESVKQVPFFFLILTPFVGISSHLISSR